MACYHPKRAWLKKYDHGGKPLFTWQRCIADHPEEWRETSIPCGKCIGCRLDYSREWATRISTEMKLYPKESNWFLTLTYDDMNVPWGETINEQTGEIITNMSLRPEDLTKFMKDLRRHYEYHANWQGIRFFACGEYGGQTKRPHYHIAIMNMPMVQDELEQIGNNKNGDALYKAERISNIWNKGFVTIGELNWQSAAYVARYITKKQIGKEADIWYKSQGIEKEFVRMSRNPGIGIPALSTSSTGNTNGKQLVNIDKMMMEDKIRVAKKRGTLDNKIPKIFNQAYRAMEPEQMVIIERNRQERANRANEIKMSKTTLNMSQQLEVEERIKEEQAKKLVRTIEL